MCCFGSDAVKSSNKCTLIELWKDSANTLTYKEPFVGVSLVNCCI